MSYGAYTILAYAGLLSVLVVAFLTFRKKLGFIQGVLFAAVSIVLSFIAAVMALNADSGQNVINLLIDEQFAGILSAVETMGEDMMQTAYGISIADFKEAIQTVKATYTAVFPSMIIISSLVMSFLLFMLIKTVLRLFRRDVSHCTDFVMLKMPKSAVTVMLISMIGSVFAKGTAANAFLNANAVLIFMFLICGYSYILYLVKQKASSAVVRGVIYVGVTLVALVLSNISSYAFQLAAMADAFLDLRNRRFKGRFDEQEKQ